jgi:triphosphoribosyl-dephospho-CoA synthase
MKWFSHARERWHDASWAAARVYLGFLAHVPDTLIERKYGERVATRVREEARPIESGLLQSASPEAMTGPLKAFDVALKERGLNPGTSADLTVATLFAAALEEPQKH